MAIDGLLGLVVYLLIAGLIIYLVTWVLGMLEISPQIKNVIIVVLTVLVLIWFIMALLPFTSLR